jgi:hypothetical protein
MKSELLPLATRLVRAWTRVYTFGVPPAERSARRAEIESDLWELEHDPDMRGRAAAQVLARLLLGIPDDLAWRLDVGAAARVAPGRALAAAAVTTGPRRVSAFGVAATMHIVAISAVMWLASPGAVASSNSSGAAASQSDIASVNPSIWTRGSPSNRAARSDRSASFRPVRQTTVVPETDSATSIAPCTSPTPHPPPETTTSVALGGMETAARASARERGV